MRDDSADLSIVATATLELGIDVGRLERAFQIDAPFTVSGFLQRMGRTGRREAAAGDVVRHAGGAARATSQLTPETLPWELLQGIALVQLYREERWVEPRTPGPPALQPALPPDPGHSGLRAASSRPHELATRVLTLTPFHRVSADDFRVLLRHLLAHRLRADARRPAASSWASPASGSQTIYKFYAVFQESVEYTVRCDSQELGTICQPLPRQARRSPSRDTSGLWRRSTTSGACSTCTQVKGRVPAYFGECAGDINTRVLVRMRQALEESTPYAYLRPQARAAPCPGPPRRQERRTHQVTAREPWGQHVVSLPLAGKLRLPRAGALSSRSDAPRTSVSRAWTPRDPTL